VASSWWRLRLRSPGLLQAPGKHPLTRHGLHDATADPGVIRRWWTRWPQANVGIRTGAASGLLVIDIDGPGRDGITPGGTS
jgi:hypothetical protein